MNYDDKKELALGIPFALALFMFPFIVVPVVTIAVLGTALWKWLDENL